MRPRWAVLLAALAAFPWALSSASPSNPRLTGSPLVRVWRADDYNASSLNTRLLVHPSGLVYVANDEGVLEFDGERWRLIELPRGGAARALALDSRQRVWVFGHDDVATLEPDERGILRAVSKLELLPRDLQATGTINRAVSNSAGVFARGQSRLMEFSDNGSVTTWPGATLNGVVWSAGDDVYADLSTLERVEKGQLKPVSLGAKTVSPDDFRVFATRRSGSSWLAVTVHGPTRWNGPGTAPEPLSPEVKADLGDDVASCGAFLADGRIAVGTERSGLLIFSDEGVLSQRVGHADGLPGNRINDLAVDERGGLWVAQQEGIARVEIDSPFALHGAAQGLAGTARRFAHWKDTLYLSSSDGVSRRDSPTGRFVPVAGFQVGANRPLPMGERLVAATRGLREITADDRSRAWTTELIGPIAASGTAEQWIYAGSSSGLSVLKPGNGGWVNAFRLMGMTQGVDELLVRDGFVWMVTRDGGVARADERQGPRAEAAVKIFATGDGLPEVPRNDHVQLVRVGRALFATCTQWTRRYDDASERFLLDGRLASGGEPVAGVLVSGAGGVDSGWFRLKANPARLVEATEGEDGEWGLDERSIAPFRTAAIDTIYEEAATHSLWLAGQGLLVSLDLAWHRSAKPAPPRVYVRTVEDAAGNVLSSGSADGTLKLGPSQNAVRITFAAPLFGGDYRGRSQTVYRTRLDGVDKDWSPWSPADSREFTNLPYRFLRFEVEARSLGSGETAHASYAFIVNPPWWLSLPALILFGTAAAAVIAGFVRWRTAALRRRNEQLEATVASRTRQLSRLNEELGDALTVVSHDLRGPVSGIRALARQLRSTPHIWSSNEGPEFLGEIERTSGAAVDMMARLLDLQRASDRAAGLTFAADDVGRLVAEVCQQFSPSAIAKGVTLTFETPELLRIVDSEAVSAVIANLVSNAIKFVPAGSPSFVRVSLVGTDDACVLTVSDNGPGVPAAERALLFAKFAKGTAKPTAGETSTGLGLHILKKYLSAMEGTVAIEETPGGGATFVVRWPARRPAGP